MGPSRENQSANNGPADGPPSPKVAPDVVSKRRAVIGRHALSGIALIAVVVIVLLVAETIPQVHAAVEYSYDWLQGRLTPVEAARRDVVVVDISNLQPRRNPSDPQAEPYTSRNELIPIIRAIVAHQPAAIGIDIDFSLTPDGEYFTKEDPGFLDFLLDQKHKQKKLFVGVASGLEKGPSKWLGNEKYKDLAAHILRPKAEGFGPNPLMGEVFSLPPISSRTEEAWELPSLAYAVAGGPPEPPRFLSWAVERKIEHEIEGVGFRQFLVDFSPIDSFAEAAIVAQDARDVRDATTFKDRIVIVGRGSKGLFKASTTDTFTVPGHRQQAYPGMMLHACAAYTLHGATLWQFKKPARLLLDVFFSAVVLGIVALVALYYSSRVEQDVSLHRLSRWLTFVMALAVIVLGHMFASRARIIWPDYVIVAGGLMLHSALEQRDSPIRVTLQALRRGWQAIGFAPSDKGHT